VDFKNTVVILTSNIGSRHILEATNAEQREALVMEALREHFRPEFLNRIDETIIFDQLKDEELDRIVDVQMGRLTARLAAQKFTLHLTPEARRRLAEEGFDPVYGARPLKRAIQRKLLDPLSLAILDGLFQEGDEIHVTLRNGQFEFRKEGVLGAVAVG
jgi:ATP-dependent Clp protease ATP-binding subunit ClpB